MRTLIGTLPLALLVCFACADEPEDTRPTLDELQATCAAQQSANECAAVERVDYPEMEQSAACVWINEMPVTLVDGACSVGELVERCQLSVAGDPGCYSPTESSCGPGGFTWAGDGMLGWAAEICVPPAELCTITAEGVQSGPPECACFCELP